MDAKISGRAVRTQNGDVALVLDLKGLWRQGVLYAGIGDTGEVEFARVFEHQSAGSGVAVNGRLHCGHVCDINSSGAATAGRGLAVAEWAGFRGADACRRTGGSTRSAATRASATRRRSATRCPGSAGCTPSGRAPAGGPGSAGRGCAAYAGAATGHGYAAGRRGPGGRCGPAGRRSSGGRGGPAGRRRAANARGATGRLTPAGRRCASTRDRAAGGARTAGSAPTGESPANWLGCTSRSVAAYTREAARPRDPAGSLCTASSQRRSTRCPTRRCWSIATASGRVGVVPRRA